MHRLTVITSRFFVLSIFLGSTLISGEFGVSPSIFEIDLGGRPQTKAITVHNFSDEEMGFAVSVAAWDLDENNRVRLLPPTEQSMDQWILINPLQLKIPARGKGTVRFSIRPRTQPNPGEHRAMIFLTEIGSHKEGNILVQGQFGVGIYGHLGSKLRQGELHGITVDTSTNPIRAFFDVTSKGNSHVRLNAQFAIWPEDLFPGKMATHFIENLGKPDTTLPEGPVEIGEVPTTPFLPGTRRKLASPSGRVLPAGKYVLDINGKLGDIPINQAIPFEVEASEPPQEDKAQEKKPEEEPKEKEQEPKN